MTAADLAAMDTLLDGREHAIHCLCDSVEEINSLQREIAFLVNEQSGMMDSLLDNVELSADHTARGVHELKKAQASTSACIVC